MMCEYLVICEPTNIQIVVLANSAARLVEETFLSLGGLTFAFVAFKFAI